MVLLHGMGGSHRYWGSAFDELATGARLVVPDLLGFGASPKPSQGYGPAEHAAAVAASLAEAGITEPALVVGHSMGAVVALALAHLRPELVSGVVAIGPPVYRDRGDARQHILAMGPIERVMAFDPPAATLCAWMCRHRGLAAWIAVLLRPDVPAPLARDAVQHTWASYSMSMEGLLLSATSAQWLAASVVPVRIVLATDDPVPDRELLEEIARGNPQVTVEEWASGGHDLPLTRPADCVAAIRRTLDLDQAGTRRIGAVAGQPTIRSATVPSAGLSQTMR